MTNSSPSPPCRSVSAAALASQSRVSRPAHQQRWVQRVPPSRPSRRPAASWTRVSPPHTFSRLALQPINFSSSVSRRLAPSFRPMTTLSRPPASIFHSNQSPFLPPSPAALPPLFGQSHRSRVFSSRFCAALPFYVTNHRLPFFGLLTSVSPILHALCAWFVRGKCGCHSAWGLVFFFSLFVCSLCCSCLPQPSPQPQRHRQAPHSLGRPL